MFQELKINGMRILKPDDDVEFTSIKLKTEYETEAGTTQVSVRRESKLSIKGSWTLTGLWAQQFRNWAEQDTVRVTCFFPFPDMESNHECQFSIKSEKHIRNAREQLRTNGLYKLSVEIEEL